MVLAWEGVGATSATLFDAFSTNNATNTGSATLTRYGMGVAFNGSSTHAIRTAVPVSNEFTFITKLKLGSVSSSAPYCSVAAHHTTNGNPSNWYIYRSSSDGKFHVDVPWVAGDVLVGSSTYSAGELREVALVRSGSTGSWTYRIYVDGRQDNSGTTASNPAGTSHSVQIGDIGGANYTDNIHLFARYWNRPLTSAEILAHYANNWQLFTPSPRRIYSFSTGTSDVTVALSGLSVTASAGTPVANNSVALSGLAATMAAGTPVPGTSIELSGLQLTASGGTVTPELGIFVGITGLSMTASYGTLSPELSVALSGTSMTISGGSVTASGGSIWTAVPGTSSTWTPRSAQSTTWTAQ